LPRKRSAQPGRFADQQAPRRQAWVGLTPAQVLARYRPGKSSSSQVLDVLLALHNRQHTALEKTVSHKTRHERAQFLRRFFRDLHAKAGFRAVPDPRNLRQKHLQAMVQVWQREQLSAATIQTYLSFLRGLAQWLGKPGLVRGPAHYGLAMEQYQRHESARRDRSWSAQGVDIDAVIEQVSTFDRYVGASLHLIRAFGLRRKEAVCFRPFDSVVAFEATGLPPEERTADDCVKIVGKGGRVRFLPVDSAARIAAVQQAQRVVTSRDAHLGAPDKDLRANLRRFDYVLERFGITQAQLGVTAHGLRHEVLIDRYQALAGQAPPVRQGSMADRVVDRAARLDVSKLAGHARIRAAGAYLGAIRVQHAGGATGIAGVQVPGGLAMRPAPDQAEPGHRLGIREEP